MQLESGSKAGSDVFPTSNKRLACSLEWQREPYDHVLRLKEREHGVFQATCGYILQNPVRKLLTADPETYRFSGAVVPGFPDLNPSRPDFWEVFWVIYNKKVGADGTAS